MTSNKARSLAFRDDVILWLRDAGFSSADRRPETKGLTKTERIRRDVGDIMGLRWTLGVHAQQTIDLSGSLDEAAAEAKRAGTELFASIQHRKNHGTQDAYVTMPLHVFAQVLAIDEAQTVSTP